MFALPIVLFFTFLSPLWWLLVVGSCIAILVALEKEKGIAAGLVVLGTIAAMVLLGDTPLIAAICDNPKTTIAIILGYFVVGAVWGIIRWTFYVDKKFNAYEDFKRTWLRNQGLSETKEIPDNLKQEFQKHLESHSEYSYSIYKDVPKVGNGGYTYNERVSQKIIQIRPLAWQNKARIGNWIGYWPWSMVWWFIDDAVRAVVRVIRNLIMESLEKISIRRFRGVENDYVVKNEDKSEDKTNVS